jgi:hypothetical protein
MFFAKTIFSALVLTGLVTAHGAPMNSLERRFAAAHQVAARDALAVCEDKLAAPAREEHLLKKREEFLGKHFGKETGLLARMRKYTINSS